LFNSLPRSWSIPSARSSVEELPLTPRSDVIFD
jgi:hypothetical protein